MGYTYASVPTLDVDNYQQQQRRQIRYSVVGGVALVVIVVFVLIATVTPIFHKSNEASNATRTALGERHDRSPRSRLWIPDGFPSITAYFDKIKNKTTDATTTPKKKSSSPTNLISMLPPGSLSYLPMAMKAYGKVTAAKKRVLSGTSSKCGAQLDELLTRLIKSGGQNTWALSFFDALGKFPSGILDGNPSWFGSRDECAEIEPSIDSKGRERFGGRYCMASIGKYTTRTVGPRHPQLPIGINVGFCMPRACSQQDFVAALGQLLQEVGAGEYKNTAQKQISKNSTVVNWSYCETTPEEWSLDARAIAVLVAIGGFVALAILGTLQEILLQYKATKDSYALTNHQSETNIVSTNVMELAHSRLARFFLSFSLLNNGRRILTTSATETSSTERMTLHSLHGIRVFTMIWIVLIHTFMFTPYLSNDIFRQMRISTKTYFFQIVLNGHLAVDTFFVLSGALLVYVFLCEADKRGGRRVSWFQYYFVRFWRLTPPMMISIGILAGLMPLFLVGPNSYFNEIMAPQRCAQSWWTNLLFVNNLFQLDQQCAPWTWYLACDMQFYLLTPLVLIPLTRRGGTRSGVTILAVLFVVHLVAAFTITMSRDVPIEIFSNMLMQDYKQLWNYYGWYYMQPWGRAGPYLIGMLLGLLLYKWQRKQKENVSTPLTVPWLYVVCGWACLPLFTLVPLFFTYPMYQEKGPYPTWINALYNTFARSFWALGISWVIFACETGYGSLVNTLLSWQALVPLSRLTYCAYLLHLPLLSYLTAAHMAPSPSAWTTATVRFGGLLFVTYLVSFVFSCLFEAPMIELLKALWEGNGGGKLKKAATVGVLAEDMKSTSQSTAEKMRDDAGNSKAGNVLLTEMNS